MPIPGTTKLHRFEENTGAANLELSAQDLANIESALQQIQIVGERYPAHLQQRVGRQPALPKLNQSRVQGRRHPMAMATRLSSSALDSSWSGMSSRTERMTLRSP